MTKKLIIFLSLSLTVVSSMAALDGVLDEETRAALAIVELSQPNKVKKGPNKGAACKGSKPKKRRPQKNRLKVVESVSDNILNFAQKRDGKNFVCLTLLEKEALKMSFKNIFTLPDGKFGCDSCHETRSTYEKMASHMATQHHGVKQWIEGPGKPPYNNYSGFATSLEMKQWK